MQVSVERQWIGRFKTEQDLLDSLTQFCLSHDIKFGVFSVIGALSSLHLGYYDQTQQKYVESISLESKLEITQCTGNISLDEGKPFVHAHITVADRQGGCFGGHLMKGAKIFAAEYFIKEFQQQPLERSFDEITGLRLWPAEDS